MKIKDDTALSWDLIQAFLALERYGRYELASENENIDDSTLRRRITLLEKRLGRQLFVRNEGGWKVSPDLHQLVAAALRMEEAASSFAQDHETGVGVVRISVLDAFAERLSPAFRDLQQKYPGIILDVTCEVNFVNLQQDKVDIAIRLARPVRNNNTLRIRKIGDVPVNAYASRDYLERLNGEAERPDFSGHQLLTMSGRFQHEDHSVPYSDIGWSDVGVSGRVRARVDSLILLQRMCENGQGVALIPTAFARCNPNLMLVREGSQPIKTELWLVTRLDMRAAWQRDLADMLQAELARWPR
jgi:DNA-binding transcriptional LysR family regulator